MSYAAEDWGEEKWKKQKEYLTGGRDQGDWALQVVVMAEIR